MCLICMQCVNGGGELPSLKEIMKFTQSEDFMFLVAAPRPEGVNLRTNEGTKARLDELVKRGFGFSRSEAAHLCLQIGLISFEGQYEDEPISPEVVDSFVPPGELDEDFPPDTDE